jgi:hypothetical protein
VATTRCHPNRPAVGRLPHSRGRGYEAVADNPELDRSTARCGGDRGYLSGPAVGWPRGRPANPGTEPERFGPHRDLHPSCEMLARHSNQALVADVQTIIVT